MKIVHNTELGEGIVSKLESLLDALLGSAGAEQVNIEVTYRPVTASQEELGEEGPSKIIDMKGKPQPRRIATDYFINGYAGIPPEGSDDKSLESVLPSFLPSPLMMSHMCTVWEDPDRFDQELYCFAGLILERLMALQRFNEQHPGMTLWIQDSPQYGARTEVTPAVIEQLKQGSTQRKPAYLYVASG